MKTLILSLVILGSTNALALSDPCPDVIPEVESKSIYSVQDKILILCDLEDKISKQQAGKVFIDFSSQVEETFSNCYAQASQSGKFPEHVNGLVKKCVSQFQNGHLKVRFKPAPSVSLTFSLIEIDGKFFVKNTHERSDHNIKNEVEIGDEVLTLDGVPVEDVVQKLTSFQFASSAGARRLRAVSAIRHRNYALPPPGN